MSRTVVAQMNAIRPGSSAIAAGLLGLLLLASPLPSQRVLEATEPNASTSTAGNLNCGQEAVGVLASVADVDWFRIVLAAPSDLRLQTGPGPGNEIGDTVVLLLDSAGAPLRANDDGIAAGYYSALAVAGLAAGTYYVAVRAGVHAATSGSYLLDLRCEAPNVPAAATFANEGPENNDPLTGGIATNVTLPVRCNGALGSTGHVGDWDVWRMLVFGDGMLRIRVGATANHANQPADDLVLYLLDAATPPNLVAGPFYASGRGAWDQAIDIRVASGLHAVAVRGVTGSQPGSYYLDLTTRATSSATVFAGGCGGRTLALPVTNAGPGAPQTLESAYLGTTYSITGSNLGSDGYAFHVLGLAPTALNLTPLGAPGCTLEVAYVDTGLQLADAFGFATWTIAVPDQVALLGTSLHSQAAVLDLSNPLGITISNRVASTIGH